MNQTLIWVKIGFKEPVSWNPSTSGISCVISNENINEMLDIVGFEEVNTVYGGSFSKPDDIWYF